MTFPRIFASLAAGNQPAQYFDDNFNASVWWAVAGGTADVITAAYMPAVTVLSDGLLLGVRFSGANTTANPTFSPDGLTAHVITKRGGAALSAGDIAGNLTEGLLRYNLANTRWELLNSALVSLTNSVGGDISLSNTGLYFDGPAVAQGSSGTWFVSGTVTVLDGAGAAAFQAKLWDGTTVIASGYLNIQAAANQNGTISLSGVITSPAGNLRISVKDSTSASGKIIFNQSGNSKDSTITAVRIG